MSEPCTAQLSPQRVEPSLIWTEQTAIKPSEKIIAEDEPGWERKADIEFLRNHWAATPYPTLEPDGFVEDWKELEEYMSNGKVVDAVNPARIILATKRGRARPSEAENEGWGK